MRTVLIASTYFSADAAIGSMRMRALAKYLPRFGWQPVILTEQIPGAPALPRGEVPILETWDPYASMKKLFGLAVPQSARGANGSIPHNSGAPGGWLGACARSSLAAIQYVLVPDLHVFWHPVALRSVRRWLTEERSLRPDIVLTSSNPRTPHLVGHSLKRLLGVPWIADLRDFWTIDHYYPYRGPRRWFEQKLERRTLASADRLVTVSRPYADRLGTFLGRGDVSVIYNGFDPAEWPAPAPEPLPRFTITYTGSLMDGRRNPTPLLEVIRELADEGEVDLGQVEVRFFGRPERWVEEQALRLGLGAVVRQYGQIPREQVLERQRESQLLLILFWDHPLDAGVLTSKLEYLATRRPILALGGPGGDMEELLEETGAGEYVRAGDHRKLKRLVWSWYQEFRRTGRVAYRGDREAVFRYSHPEMARHFAGLLEETLAAARCA